MSISLAPIVVPIAQPTSLVLDHLTPGATYVAHVHSRRGNADIAEHTLSADDRGQARFEATYTEPGEHTVDVCPSPATDRLARLSFYAATLDLARRRPLRCDMHIHTGYSDGRSTPAEMLIRGRELGLDVAVITDHNDYHGAIEGIEARDKLSLNLITMPGEEVSGPNWHTLSINADQAIYDLMMQAYGLEDEERRAQWRETAGATYEALRWAIEATQAHGGRAYLAHPYWTVDRGFHLPVAMYEQVLAEGILDGIELLGDVDYEDNMRSLARYLDFRAGGHDVPILGNSDTHGPRHVYGVYWTLVLADDVTPQGVLDAIAGGWSVACTTVKPVDVHHRAEQTHAFGPFELVDYTYFCEHRFFPAHDALCLEEASLAYRAWRGEPLPEQRMAEQKAKMEALYARSGNWVL